MLLMNVLLVRSGTLMILKDFLHPWAGDPGMAENGGAAWVVSSAFLPFQKDLPREPSCHVK